ncbi:hypothetical protein I79_010964 [Cricetulus griseus]|uniref:Uncharacterized protein n=1 Tax=Cricetulus griseus TaxID=10029 RepID=G3HJW2_CRIGR|nr:hypothetical protein I79_010964 [Cricetulus griseus]
MASCLPWNLGWPQIQRPAYLCLLSGRVKGVCYHTQPLILKTEKKIHCLQFFFFMINFHTKTMLES